MNAVSLPHSIQSQTLLVVDDNAASLYATTRILRAAGFKVLEAMNGSDALAFATEDIGLVILDINLPDMDGLEVCRQLRARTYAAYLPIVHLSATFVTTADMAQGLNAGADSYLTHPADPAVLLATVRTLLFARQSELVRRETDTRFRAVFELAASGIALLDRELRFTDANPAFCSLAGRERTEIAGKTLVELIDPSRRGAYAEVERALKEHARWEGVLPVRRPDDSVAEVEWRLATENPLGARIAIATDATERRRAEAERENILTGERAARGEAERQNRVKDEFLATLSHELRNPLTAIMGWVNVLRRTPGSSPDVLRGLEVIERNSRLQSHLIADLLDYAGMRFGKMHLEMGVVDPGAAVQAAFAVVAPLARAKSVLCELELSDRNARVIGDEGRMQQIVWNLANNAIKFTPAAGSVLIRACSRDGQYEISVSDTGRGISPQFLPYIFDRFSQQDAGSSKSFAGLGIGLTIVKHLVEVHHGTIEAQSQGEGRGATFVVRIPLTKEKPRALPEVPASRRLEHLRILVVEDDDDTREFIVRILRDAGATVTHAASGDEALAQIHAGVPDLLVSDIGMARQDGYQLIQTVRSAGYSPGDLPAVALTAFSRAEDKADAMTAGFQVHLAKPVEADRLIGAIVRLRAVEGGPPAS
jgi:PAS domain S-box-containing protein